ncbi:MAG: RNA-binding S4 domain-containing protein [Bacteroidales bacterium]|nr:RNA-binding S4 domain-containing protein [Bacteroidales bacterium]
MTDKVRIDKFLWAIRLYKTRSLATDACNAGKVHIGEITVKPSRDVAMGNIIEIHKDGLCKTIRVKELLSNRVGAALVQNYIEDLTPPEEYARIEMLHKVNSEYREHGSGRPTKKDRREIERLKDIY